MITPKKPGLTTRQKKCLREFFSLPSTASTEAVMRAWAGHYWYNKGIGMRDGDPIDANALKDVPVEKLLAIADYYQADYGGIGKQPVPPAVEQVAA